MIRRFVRQVFDWCTARVIVALSTEPFLRLSCEIHGPFGALGQRLIIEDELTMVARTLVEDTFVYTRVALLDGWAYLTRGPVRSPERALWTAS